MFNEILGQEKAVNYLQKLVREDRVPGALLFCGPDGVGKKKTALEFAKALVCDDVFARQEGQACGACASCQAVAKGTHPDVTLIDFAYQARLEMKEVPAEDYEEEFEKTLAKQQHLKIDTIRTAAARSQQKAVQGGWKVLIVDQAQCMQGPAANALLKFIEEPPAKTVWILITSKRAAMLGTILSRCQLLPFAPLQTAQVEQLVTACALDVADPARAARYSGGSVSGALKAAQALELLEAGGFGSPAGPGQVAAKWRAVYRAQRPRPGKKRRRCWTYWSMSCTNSGPDVRKGNAQRCKGCWANLKIIKAVLGATCRRHSCWKRR